MKASFRLSAVLLFILPCVSQAHLLRRTYEDCVRVLGKPDSIRASNIPPAVRACVFHNKDWTRIIHFWRDRAHAISFFHTDGSPPSFDEVVIILERFGKDQGWQHGDSKRVLYWNSDHSIAAVSTGDGISIVSAEFFRAAGLGP